MDTAAVLPAAEPHILARLNCPLEALEELCKEYDVTELSVFGSIVRDDFDAAKSDIDFMVVFHPDSKLDLGGYFELEEKLSELVHRKVDLVSKASMRRHWHDAILPTAQLIYANE